ncbi:predicted protein [Postia placenta Mad-698-R]|nr:predicted protein [Postia placenta Mad-698-R]
MATSSTSTSHDHSNHSKSNGEAEPALDVSALKELARKGLVDALNSVNGAKTLVLDPSLAGPLGLVTEVALLKHHGVDKMFWLESGPLSATTTNIIYLCRPLVKWIKIIADQLKRLAREPSKHTYTLLLVPRISTLVSRILEEEGVLGDITISSYNLQFIPVAEDIVSLENESAFKELYTDGDETVIYNSMQALMTLQRLYGPFPRVLGKGDFAQKLATLLTRHPPQSGSESSSGVPNAPFDSLIIIDRGVDMITPLLTQLTYKGLIDEMIGIRHFMQREQPTTTAVFFLGGCTYTEIAALRWVGRQSRGRKFLIATTGIVSGASLVESIAGVEQAGALSKDAGLS